MLVPKEVLCLGKICHSENTRYSLGAVRLERSVVDNKSRAIATDGSILAAVEFDDAADCKDYPPAIDVQPSKGFETLISRSDLEIGSKIVASYRKSRHGCAHRLAVNEMGANGSIRLGVTDGTSIQTADVRSVEGRFPQWRDLFPVYMLPDVPAGSSLAVRIKLDPNLLTKLVSVIQTASGATDPGVWLTIPYTGKSAVIVECEGTQSARGMIMPMA